VSTLNFSRRDLLRGRRCGPLIGTATAAEAYQPTSVAALKGSGEIGGDTDSRVVGQ